jgi:hypothetical protein
MAYMHEDPREFLVIDASGVTWKVSVEEGLPPWHRVRSLIETLRDCAYLYRYLIPLRASRNFWVP